MLGGTKGWTAMTVAGISSTSTPLGPASWPARTTSADNGVPAMADQGQGGGSFNLTTPAGVADARGQVAGALANAAAKAQANLPQVADGGRQAVQLSAANSVVTDAVQANTGLPAYSASAQPPVYGTSLPRGNVIDAVA